MHIRKTLLTATLLCIASSNATTTAMSTHDITTVEKNPFGPGYHHLILSKTTTSSETTYKRISFNNNDGSFNSEVASKNHEKSCYEYTQILGLENGKKCPLGHMPNIYAVAYHGLEEHYNQLLEKKYKNIKPTITRQKKEI